MYWKPPWHPIRSEEILKCTQNIYIKIQFLCPYKSYMRENKKETLYILILKVLKFMFVYWFPRWQWSCNCTLLGWLPSDHLILPLPEVLLFIRIESKCLIINGFQSRPFLSFWELKCDPYPTLLLNSPQPHTKHKDVVRHFLGDISTSKILS